MANTNGANIYGARLANIYGARLANIYGANINGARLSDIYGANIYGARLPNSNGANANETHTHGTPIANVSNINGARLSDTNGADINGAPHLTPRSAPRRRGAAASAAAGRLGVAEAQLSPEAAVEAAVVGQLGLFGPMETPLLLKAAVHHEGAVQHQEAEADHVQLTRLGGGWEGASATP